MDIITWNINPNLVDFGVIQIRWYGLLFAVSFVFGNFFLNWIFEREKQPKQYADRLLMHMILGTILGARLGHCLFYEPGYYLSNPLEILKIWRGGLASHGAGIGLFIAVYLYVRKTPGQSYFWIMDRLVIVIAFSGFMIRLGNLFNSEILGKPTDGTWGMIFKRIDSIPRHPAQIYESVAYLIIFIFLMTLFLKTTLYMRSGFLGGTFLVLIFMTRFVVEQFKENQVPFEVGMRFNMGQILSIPMILLGFLLILRAYRVPPSKILPK
ncbi:MAG: prolipoprotein diacylglyceryl transferase [Proteobacteria bacterium]|nr:prolipoprotein diacylglyceryl transferase [Pseudomonadota bacterium]